MVHHHVPILKAIGLETLCDTYMNLHLHFHHYQVRFGKDWLLSQRGSSGSSSSTKVDQSIKKDPRKKKKNMLNVSAIHGISKNTQMLHGLYTQTWVILAVNVHKSSSTMKHMG